MSFLSVLKKIGQQANKFDSLIPVVGTYVHFATSLIPGEKDDKIADKVLAHTQDGLLRLQGIILDAEVFGQAIALPGSQKAAAVAPAVNQLLMDSLPLLRGKKPKDAAQTKADAAALGGALAKYLNGFEG